MDKSFLHIKVISIYLLISAVCRISYSCSGFNGSGHTYPRGDIFIEYNTSTPLEITCVITNESWIDAYPNISSNLRFMKDKTYVPEDKIIRLNETSIKLVENDPEKMATFYLCTRNGSTICLNLVAVGTKPQPVTDFNCIGFNYENLTCSWTPPQNYVTANYSLSYTFPKARAGSRVTDCNVTDNMLTGKKICYWDLKTNPHYRQAQDIFNFTLKSQNHFGMIEQVFLFEHFKNILSGPPENLSCVNSTTSSLFLWWSVPNAIVPISVGLQHRILYQCKFGPKIWQNGGLIETYEKREIYFNLTGLKYAHDVCDVRVSIRVRGADSEKMWSTNSSVTALTSSTIPGAPPRVTVGGFQTDITSSNRDIYVYWQQVPIEIRNAEDFIYSLTISEGSPDIGKLTQLTNSYAKFSNMSLNMYQFTIRSKNSEGFSTESVILTVPPNDQLIGEPVLFTKVAFDNGFYKLSWEEPKIGAEYVENYTIFWCINEKDRPYQCAGYLNWTVVSATTRDYNITVKEEYVTQFAISANNATSSSGMVWASCTVMHNKLITKIKEVFINSLNSTTIDLGWKLDCADRSDSVSGFVIYYCPRAKGPACTKRMNTTIRDPKATSGVITGLTPYTTYMLTVSVLNTKGSESLESDPLYNTTFEGTPTEPYELEAVLVTNSSISVTWQPPERLNGYLRNYFIYYNNNKTATSGNKTSFTLEYLQSDAIYNISITACTLYCSNRSTPISIRTKKGHPGIILDVFKDLENNSLVLRWIKPEGSSNLFEIKRVRKFDDGNVTDIITNITETHYNLLNCDQDDKESYFVSVRAINRDGNTSYNGPWSADLETSCNLNKGTINSVWMIIALGSVFLLLAILFSGKKLYIHFNEMKTIDVKLPAGLDPQIDTSWTQPKPDMSPSDEERLLNKTFVPPCVDSSGCSSGKGSVTSDSAGSISNGSDSGTEQPKTPLDEDPKRLLIDAHLTKLADSQPYIPFSEHSTPWSSGSGNGNGYSMYGIPDSGNTDIELTNVPSGKNTLEPSYMTCDQVKKQADTSYIPLKSNTQEKNPPYILAANKDSRSNIFYPTNQNGDDKAYVQVADANGVLAEVGKNMEKVQSPSENVSNGYVSFGDVQKDASQEANLSPSDDALIGKSNGYVSFGDAHQISKSPTEDVLQNSTGYVSFGDAPKVAPQVNASPYIPHRT